MVSEGILLTAGRYCCALATPGNPTTFQKGGTKFLQQPTCKNTATYATRTTSSNIYHESLLPIKYHLYSVGPRSCSFNCALCRSFAVGSPVVQKKTKRLNLKIVAIVNPSTIKEKGDPIWDIVVVNILRWREKTVWYASKY